MYARCRTGSFTGPRRASQCHDEGVLPIDGRRKGAFTLIELLIVVAIIGILAAIAIPNFQDAKMRAIVAKMQSDLKTLGDALHVYKFESRCYFAQMSNNPHAELRRLTTPIRYISDIPDDPFRLKPSSKHPSKTANFDYSHYSYRGKKCKTGWILHGLGPDYDEDGGGSGLTPEGSTKKLFLNRLYHRTNGLRSSGDIMHVSWRGISF